MQPESFGYNESAQQALVPSLRRAEELHKSTTAHLVRAAKDMHCPLHDESTLIGVLAMSVASPTGRSGRSRPCEKEKLHVSAKQRVQLTASLFYKQCFVCALARGE